VRWGRKATGLTILDCKFEISDYSYSKSQIYNLTCLRKPGCLQRQPGFSFLIGYVSTEERQCRYVLPGGQ
jgi:hypothetical protein